MQSAECGSDAEAECFPAKSGAEKRSVGLSSEREKEAEVSQFLGLRDECKACCIVTTGGIYHRTVYPALSGTAHLPTSFPTSLLHTDRTPSIRLSQTTVWAHRVYDAHYIGHYAFFAL